MRLRRTWAGVLAAMLLFVSFAASRCEAQCDLNGLQPACHAQTMSAIAQGNAQAVNCHGDFAMASSAMLAVPCLHHVCEQPPAVLSDHRSALARVPVLVNFMPVASRQFISSQVAQAFAGRGPPFFLPPSPVELHLLQRV